MPRYIFMFMSIVNSTAVDLMRSRYEAFIKQDFEHLLKTHDPETLSEFDIDANKKWASDVVFTKLEIISSHENGKTAVVEFKAHFIEKKSGLSHVHHERSEFRKINKNWYFRNGQLVD